MYKHIVTQEDEDFMKLVEITALSSLGGKIGAHPLVNACYPAEQQPLIEKNIMKILPEGAKPSEIYKEVIKKHPVMVYVFKIDEESERDTLASVGFVLHKNINLEGFQTLTELLFALLEIHNLLTFEILINNLGIITDAINKEQLFTIKGINGDNIAISS